MSLKEALLIAGLLLIAALVLHAAWQSRKADPQRALKGEPKGTAGASQPPRLEPGFDDGSGVADAAALDPDDAAGASGDGGEMRPAARARASSRLDALVDLIVPLKLESAVSGEALIGHLPPSWRAGTKPFGIEALEAAGGEWERPQPGRRYVECQAGVLLANRSGPLNEIEYSEFVQKIERYAEAIGASAEFPDMLEVVARARELDAFAGAHDAQLAILLRARGTAWSVGYVQQRAGAHGFVPGAVPGRLIRPSPEEGAPPVLTLSHDPQAAFAEDPNQATLRQLTLALDVPQTEAEGEPFDAWRQAARELADALEAEVIDDAGQPLPDAAFEQIGQELGQLYTALQRRDLAAGSPAARRLFS